MFATSVRVGRAFFVLLAISCCLRAREEKEAGDDIEKLIDELAEITEPGFGYSAYFSGSDFSPYEGTGEISTGVLGGMRRAPSEALKKIVERGADAVPILLKHMDDDRTLKRRTTPRILANMR